MFRLKALKTVAAAGLLALMAAGAQAATTTLCPNTAITTDREFSLTTQDPIGNTCFFSGSPNDNNDIAFQTALAALVPSATLLGKIENKDGALVQTGPQSSLLNNMIVLLDGTGGSFTLDLTGIVNAILVFKVGNNPGPAYAAYAVDSGFVNGSWFTTPIQGGGLSHVSLYGSPAPIPVPAAGLLLLGALGGLAALRRRRKAA